MSFKTSQERMPQGLASKLRAARDDRQMEGEWRVIIMLFCDVTGSAAMAERLDPEEWAEIMDEAFNYLIAPVYRYEGTLARLMGDGILAFFGAPIGLEDDPSRAVLAYIFLQKGDVESALATLDQVKDAADILRIGPEAEAVYVILRNRLRLIRQDYAPIVIETDEVIQKFKQARLRLYLSSLSLSKAQALRHLNRTDEARNDLAWALEEAELMGSRFQRWPIFSELVELETMMSHSQAADRCRMAAVEVIHYLAEHMDGSGLHGSLQESFLNLPRVKAVISL